MSQCSRCGAGTLPHSGCCLECGFDAEVEQRPVTRRIHVQVVETTQRDALEGLLRRCAPGSADSAARLVGLGQFDIAAEGRPQEISRLEAACSAVGARAQVSDQYAPNGTRLVWDWSGWIRTKMFAAACLGGLGIGLGVPVVTVGSTAMVLWLARRAAHLVETSLTVSSGNLQASFRAVDPQLFAKLRAARQRVTRPEVVSMLRECADAFAELAWQLRSDGAALGNRSLQRLDTRLHRLVERACGLAQAANDSTEPAPPKGLSPELGLDAVSLLATIRDRLLSLSPMLAESRGEERNRIAVANALEAIADVDAVIDRALQTGA